MTMHRVRHAATILRTHVRAVHPGPSPTRSTPTRVGTVFTALALVGAGATAYGLYDVYTSFAVWPSELRVDLRPAIKAQHRGDLALSERHLRRAWQTCRTLPREALGAAEPWLKISGIACKLGEVLEAAHLPHKAYDVYAECLALMQASAARNELSRAERHRAVALAIHLGALADQLQRFDDEEKFLSWSVEELLRANAAHTTSTHAAELNLPEWTSNDDLGAALETLGSFYAKTGKIDYALTLYLHALSTILPHDPSPTTPPTPHRQCIAAQTMTNISSLLTRTAPTPARLAHAHTWSAKGLELAAHARDELARARTADPACERVWAVLLFNLGAVLEMQRDHEAARAHFVRARAHAHAIGMEEGVAEADGALARLRADGGSATLSGGGGVAG